jgi:hypothetical protein
VDVKSRQLLVYRQSEKQQQQQKTNKTKANNQKTKTKQKSDREGTTYPHPGICVTVLWIEPRKQSSIHSNV